MLRILLLAAVALGTAAPGSGQTGSDDEPALPIDPAAEQELLALAGPGARIRRTEHFVIAYDTPEDTVGSLVSRLEATYRGVHRLCSVSDIPVRRLEHRLPVLFFHRYEDYGRCATACNFPYSGSAGFYNQKNNVATFVNILNLPELAEVNQSIQTSADRIAELRKQRPPDREALQAEQHRLRRLTNERDRIVEQTNRLAVQHEVAHQVLFNIGVHVLGAQNPGWVVEGLACMFETPPSSSGAGVGAINQGRLADFRACLGDGSPNVRLKPEDLEVALRSGKFLPLTDLIGDPDLFSRRGDPNLVHYYTQAWSLVFYLHKARRAEFAEYLRLLGRRKVGETTTRQRELADFEGALGPLDDNFKRRWVAYILSLQFKP